MYRISKKWTFDAAHHLDGLPEGHKCARVHGHTWTVEVVLAAVTLTGPGFVTDFGELAPLFFRLALPLFPAALELIPVHGDIRFGRLCHG